MNLDAMRSCASRAAEAWLEQCQADLLPDRLGLGLDLSDETVCMIDGCMGASFVHGWQAAVTTLERIFQARDKAQEDT